MIRTLVLTGLLIVLLNVTGRAQQAPLVALADVGRSTVTLDADWRFIRNDVAGAEAVGLDDSQWRRVGVPHDWSIEGPFDPDHPAEGSGGFLPAGIGWYRKHFRLPDFPDRRVRIEFDGVMANSDVWINGHHLGQRPSGYVSFTYDLTDHVRWGENQSNVLAVRVDNSGQPASRWYTGAGIYRPARLVITSSTHVSPWGVFVSTAEVTPEKATVNIATTLERHAAEAGPAQLHTQLRDDKGTIVAETTVEFPSSGAKQQDFQQSLSVPRPRLWSLEDPRLYEVESRVLVDGEPVDAVVTTLGIRHIEFRAATGFWLNGQNVKLKGVCLHHDGGAVGAAVPRQVWQRRLERLQEIGVNAIRTAHNPVAPGFLDLCDRRGLLVMNEFFDVWTVGKRTYDYHRHFEQWANRDLADTIRRDRNHPCVVIYSVGNEIRDTHRPDHAQRILQGLVDLCHQLDPTRPVTQGLFRPNVTHDYDNGLADLLDVVGTNYRDLELLAAWRDNPRRKIIGTEQSHDRRTWLNCRDNPQHAGQFLWVGVDYLGESPRWPITTFNGGLLDRTGDYHPRGWERRSWWSDQPVVRVMRRIAENDPIPVDPGYETVEWRRRQVLFSDWSPADRGPHAERVEVYTNCDEVELLLNGKSLGKQQRPGDAQPLTWSVPFQPGELRAVASNAGQAVATHQLRTAGEPAAIRLEVDRMRLTPTWDDVATVEVRIVDASGVLVPTAAQHVTFSIDGPGEVVAVDNGSIVSHEPLLSHERDAFHGRCIAIVRATADTGEIVLQASSPGLDSAVVRLAATRAS